MRSSQRISGVTPWVMGIGASHNGGFCLLHGNKISVAVQEERLSGIKRARVFGGRQSLGLRYCFETAGITAADLAMVVLSCQRSAELEENNLLLNPEFSSLSALPRRVVSHHLAHAASVFAASGFEHSAVLVVDGQGSPISDLCDAAKRTVLDPSDDASEHLSLFQGHGNTLTPLEIHVTHRWLERKPNGGMGRFYSFGGMYSAAADQIFGDPMEAGKVMGLAPYGVPSIPVEEFINFNGNRIEFPNIVQERFPYAERWPLHILEYQNLAASVQRALEVALMRIATRLLQLTNESCLCFAGGVALNSVANQRICEESGFRQVYVIPSAEDSGVAIGAAYLGLWELDSDSQRKQFRIDALGRTATSDEIGCLIESIPDIAVRRPTDLLCEVAVRLNHGEIGGWFQGGSELGPRALGQRSILCSPISPGIKEVLNARVKFRESFRPFAPAVLGEHASSWFDFGSTSCDNPFMLRVVPFRPERRNQVPAVVHIDGSGRVQTLTKDDNGVFYDLVSCFHVLTGVPILLNTSMNVRGEPIVETVEDALWCFLGTGLDFCVIHDRLVTKAESFHSVLDYVPVVKGECCTLGMTMSGHRLEASVSEEYIVMVHVHTRWGETDTVLPPRALMLLSKINGRLNGHDLVTTLPEIPSAKIVLHDLLLLRRMKILEFCKQTMNHQIEILAAHMDAAWIDAGRADADFSKVTTELSSEPLELDFEKLVRSACEGQELPDQRRLDQGFGQPTIMLYRSPHLTIEALCLHASTPAIHKHGCSGALHTPRRRMELLDTMHQFAHPRYLECLHKAVHNSNIYDCVAIVIRAGALVDDQGFEQLARWSRDLYRFDMESVICSLNGEHRRGIRS
jgi:carbamoyltransferase